MSQTKSYMTIGDVLKILESEFPDISISKIRYLETEGLIEPERTHSRYRKFDSTDLARLKYILRLQRDQFMPLKVIRKRLEHFDPATAGLDEPSDEAVPAVKSSAKPKARANGAAPIDEDEFSGFDSGLNLSLDQLISMSGLDESQVQELEDFGLIDPHSLEDGSTFYDEDDLVIATLSKDFGKYGIEARHLKMYRLFADKEAGIFQQAAGPLTRSASGEGRRQATQSLFELAKLSKRLKHLLLKAALRDQLSP